MVVRVRSIGKKDLATKRGAMHTAAAARHGAGAVLLQS